MLVFFESIEFNTIYSTHYFTLSLCVSTFLLLSLSLCVCLTSVFLQLSLSLFLAFRMCLHNIFSYSVWLVMQMLKKRELKLSGSKRNFFARSCIILCNIINCFFLRAFHCKFHFNNNFIAHDAMQSYGSDIAYVILRSPVHSSLDS